MGGNRGMDKKIGLIDVDGHNFPNIPLMKISAWHKAQGDSVEWYDAMFSGHMDKVYMSKVFSASQDYQYFVDADEVVKGGSGYCIETIGGREIYNKAKDTDLPAEIEHIYPDYSIYFNDNDLAYDEITGECLGLSAAERKKRDTAYGFLTRGCPRGCDFCHVAVKEGRRSYKVADLSEFWRGQKNIVLCDPNILACREWPDLLQQLIDSKANVDINQGLDIRLMTKEKAEMLGKIKMDQLHFAWDRYQDKDMILPKLQMFREMTNKNERSMIVYVLCNFDTTVEQDLERIYTLRKMGYWAYVMLYDKEHIPQGHILRKIARWVNNRFIFAKCETFEEYAG
jgi:hypothetical protein